MKLADTNIFLEILLKQKKSEKCKGLLIHNSSSLFISDFSLHSIGVILLRNKKYGLFREFLDDILPKIRILSLPTDAYELLADAAERFNLDFDDAYQYTIAKQFDLEIATIDQDLKRVDDVNVIFL
jgi:predicted nucleic acid-binding protein